MTDFLSALLDRALDRAPVLERRRASLFEPVAGFGPSFAPPMEGSTEEIGYVPRTLPSAPERMEPALVHHPRATPSEETAAPSNVTPAPPPAPPPSIERTPFRETPRVPVTPAPNETVVVAKRIETEERRIERETEIVRPVMRTAPAPPVETRREATRPAPSPAFEAQRPRATDEMVAQRAEPRELALKIPVIPVAARPAKPAAPAPVLAQPPRPLMRIQPAEQERKSAEPTVQVTIGRIEIRAVPPPWPHTAAPRPTTPKLKLEDYLRARSGGRL
jgi:hypothetical protein